jgi:metal-dependent hydrolase (beta-lactamase superfamily II)
LDLDLSYCEAVISSHGHIANAGGLLNIRRKMYTKENIPFLLVHEHAFRKRLVCHHQLDISLSRLDIVEQDASSQWIRDSILVTGDFEKVVVSEIVRNMPNAFIHNSVGITYVF